MHIHQIFRYPYKPSPTTREIDGYPNFYFFTATPGCRLAKLDRGINSIAEVKAPDGARVPAILISSSPHKIGSSETPWQDLFNPDEGHVRYFGDNKHPGRDPGDTRGNRALLKAKLLQDSLDINRRRMSPPILLFKRVTVGGRVKGFPSFHGFGVIERAELIPQFDSKGGRSFSNYAYDISVFDMSAEQEEFDWKWISDRRNPVLSIKDTESFAPKAWRTWIRDGSQSIPRLTEKRD